MSFMDWDSVWESLDWDNKETLDLDQTLAQRAVKYARPAEQDTQEDEDTLKVLVYIQGQERYAIPVNYVQRGVAEPVITPLPCVPAYYRGVINMRGNIMSVLDLRRFWGIPTEAPPDRARLIVVQAGTLEFAILADDVLEMTGIPLTEIVPPVTAGIGLDHVQGISTAGLVIVDVASLATDPQLFVHDEI